MAGVDNRIVTMKFDNRDFETNARTSLSTLQKLKESMNFGSVVTSSVNGLSAISSALGKIGLKTPFAPMIEGAQKGLGIVSGLLDKLGIKNPFANATTGAGELQKGALGATNGMGQLDGAVTGVSAKFVALSTIAITALSNITNKAVNAATSFVKGFTFAPVIDGLREYETNLKSVQVIQANTDRPLPEINRALDQLNQYSDQTIYNFSEMAKNIGTFTAAGVDLKTSVSAIKGIANMAALSGSNSQQASTAMYQLSQALAAGKVGLMDWNSVVNAGMGGKKLQNALAQTAIAMGDIDAAQVKGTKSGEQLKIMGNSFRESIMAKPGEESWLSSEILAESLASLDGRYSVAALKQQTLEDGTRKYKTTAEAVAAVEKARNEAAKRGVTYTDEQFKALQKLSTSSFKAATEVKTLGQVFDVLKETIASGWSGTFRNIFGDLKEAKAVFTPMSEALSGFFSDAAIKRNEMLAEWKEAGGRDDLIAGLKSAWQAFASVLGTVRDAFRDVFPAKTADDLLAMTERFKEFAAGLKPSEETLKNFKDTFRGIFSIFSIAKQVIGGAIGMFKDLFSTLAGDGGGFLEFTGGVGNAITALDRAMKKSGVVKAFFDGLGQVLAVPLKIIRNLAKAMAGLFEGFDTGAITSISTKTGEATRAISGLGRVMERVKGIFSKFGEIAKTVGSAIANGLSNIGEAIANSITADTFDRALRVIETGLLGGILLLLKKFISGDGIKLDLSGGVFGNVTETLGEVQKTLQNMQASIKADIILKIAGALALLTASIFVLSTIDPKKLATAMSGIALGFVGLQVAMTKLGAAFGFFGAAKITLLAGAMTTLAGALLLLSVALKIMGTMNFQEMVVGLSTMGIALFIMTKAMGSMAGMSGPMLRASIAMNALAVSMNLMAIALKIMGSMSLKEMAISLGTLAVTLGLMVAAMSKMPANLQLQATGLVALGAAIAIIAVALKIFASMSLSEMGKGLVMLAASLNIVATAIGRMPPTMALMAAGLLIAAGAISVLSMALKVMGSMSIGDTLQSLVLLGGALLVLSVGLNSLGPMALLGAAALMAAAAALVVLTPVLVTLGAMSWEGIVKGLVMLAGVFVVLGAAGVLLAPVVPVILALSVSILALGAGLALAGSGAMMLATAFGIFVGAGGAAIAIIARLIAIMINSLPSALKAFGKGLGQLAGQIAKAAPKFGKAISGLLSGLLNAVIKNAPKMGRAFMAMLNTALRVIVQATPKIVNAGLTLILRFLEAIDKKIVRITQLAINIVVKFINTIAKNLPKIIQSGVNLIIKFINGVAKAIDNNSERMGKAGARLAVALVRGMANGIRGGAGVIKDAALEAARGAWESAKDFFKIGSPSKLMRDEVGARISQGMALGIKDDAPLITKEIGAMGKTAMDKLGRTLQEIDKAFGLDPSLTPTVSPVLDLTALTKEANKMSGILETVPIMPTVSYQTAADISAATQASAEAEDGPDGPGSSGGGDTYITYEHHLHSPTALDSVKVYRDGKSLISMKKEELANS